MAQSADASGYRGLVSWLTGLISARGIQPDSATLRRQQQIALVSKSLLFGGVNSFNALFVALVSLPGHGPVALLWAAPIIAAGLFFAWTWVVLRNRTAPKVVSGRILKWASAWAALVGSWWGLSIVFLSLGNSEIGQFFAVFVLTGMMAGITATLSPVPSVPIAFCAPCLVPAMVMFATSGVFEYQAVAFLMLVFTAAMMVTALAGYKQFKALLVAQGEAEAANRSKSEFLATMSHEIRTPLGAVIGMTDIMSRTALTPEQQSQVKTIQMSSRSLLSLLNDILDFSRLEVQTLSLDPQPFAVRDTVHQVLGLMRVHAEEKSLALGVEITGAVPDWVLGDDGRIRQVLLNLVSNAIKFTDSGHIDVRLACQQLSSGLVRFDFAVTDTGIGVSDDFKARLFERFSQADTGHARQYQGAGLGLAICDQLVRLMGGHMTVDSQPGTGSSFGFSVDLVPCKNPGTDPQTDAINTSPRPDLCILFAEDNPVNRSLVVQFLKPTGWHVDTVVNGAEALERMVSKTYDILLTDIQMPVMDGETLLRSVRAVTEPARSIPVIAVTANALPAQIERYEQLGFDDYVPKPVDADLLLRKIVKHTDRRTSRGGAIPQGLDRRGSGVPTPVPASQPSAAQHTSATKQSDALSALIDDI